MTRNRAKVLRPFRRRPRRAGPVRNAAFRPLRSAAAGPAAIATVLVALTAGFGGAPASAATLHASQRAAHVAPARPTVVTGVTWHTLSLLNGWRSEQAQWNSGNPSWAVKGGVVYLSGSLHQPTGTKAVFAVLPPVARPAHSQLLTVYTENGTTGTFVVEPTGQMFVASSPSSDAHDYTSLAGVSFPAARTAMHKLSLLNGWQPNQFHTEDPEYTVAGGVVHLSGVMSQSAPGSDVFAVLPPGARPARVLYFTVFTAFLHGVLMISPDGEMQAYQGNAPGVTSLAGVSFPAATTAVHKLSLRNGWQSGQSAYGTGDPAYTVTGGVVHLSGSMVQTAGTDLRFAVLPLAARPRHNLWIKTYTFGGAVGALLIRPSGVMSAFNVSGNAAQAYTSLAGIAYPLGS